MQTLLERYISYTMTEPTYHTPALLKPTISVLDIQPSGIYADATMGGAGHTRAILSHLGNDGRVLAFDRDLDAHINAPDDPRITVIHSNFRYMPNFMRYYGISKLDGILADLGVSFHHFDSAERGFSFRADAPLDMRMNTMAPQTAADIIASSTPEQLIEIFRDYTDLNRPDKIAYAIVQARSSQPIQTTFQLAEAVSKTINPSKEKKDLAQVFQALRIAVNDELADLKAFLPQTMRMLRPGGVLAILTYHSLEDRIVKRFMRSGNISGEIEKDFYGKSSSPWINLTRNGIQPDKEEIELNPRARSARLRAVRMREDFTP